jgi:hypothetical protein
MAFNYVRLPAAEYPTERVNWNALAEGAGAIKQGFDRREEREFNALLGNKLAAGDFEGAARLAAEKGKLDKSLELTKFMDQRSDNTVDRALKSAQTSKLLAPDNEIKSVEVTDPVTGEVRKVPMRAGKPVPMGELGIDGASGGLPPGAYRLDGSTPPPATPPAAAPQSIPAPQSDARQPAAIRFNNPGAQ